MFELLASTIDLICGLVMVMAWLFILVMCIAFVVIFPIAVIAGIYWLVCLAFNLVFYWFVPIILGLIFLLAIGMATIEEE